MNLIQRRIWKPVTRYLRYISAGDVLPVLGAALTEPGAEAAGAAPGGGGPLPVRALDRSAVSAVQALLWRQQGWWSFRLDGRHERHFGRCHR